jgi:hypothetical protein
MRIRVAVPDEHVTSEVVEPILEAVTRLNQHMLATGQTPTSHEAIASGAIWRPENPGDEFFDHGGTIASRGWGDCDDWAPLHAATLRATGEDPNAKVRMVSSGPNTYHALVERGDGSIEDPSVAAGMKPLSGRLPRVIGGDETIQIMACDPHDGRVYAGQLAPAVGPLSMHCGPGLALRGCHVIGQGPLYEARVDVPLLGSRLVHVRSFTRRLPHRHRGRHHVHGAVPYAISVTHSSPWKAQALHGAIVGAILCGDAAEMTTSLDRYKLLALQNAMAGLSPGQVRDSLIATMHADLTAAAQESGRHPEEHSKELLAQTMPAPDVVVGGFFSDLGHIASSVVSDVSHVASSVAADVGPWVGDILHGVEAAVSVVPGLGTAVSDIVATAETAYESAAALLSGNPFEAAIDAAYNYALASVPGAAALHPILDPVKKVLIDLTIKHEPIEASVLDGVLSKVPDVPKLGSVSPRSVAASLAHLIVGHLGVKTSKGVVKVPLPKVTVPKAAPVPVAHAKVPVAAPAPIDLSHMRALVFPVAHAATAANPNVPPHPTAMPAPALARGSGQIWHCQPLPGGQWACQWA